MWQKNKSKCRTKLFNSKEDIKPFLTNFFAEINKGQEYNIYLHQINDFYDNVKKMYGTGAIKLKVSSIIRNGFSIRKYSALSGTAMLIGTTNNFDIDRILNYEYYKQLDCVAICIIAIPKYINIDGNKVEYSSYLGKDAQCLPNELLEQYIKTSRFKPDIKHCKCSLFDAIKQNKELPNCYMLGVLQLENSKNKYSFIQIESHLSKLGQEEMQKHNRLVQQLIVNLYNKYNTTDNKKIITKVYIDEQIYYENVESFDI